MTVFVFLIDGLTLWWEIHDTKLLLMYFPLFTCATGNIPLDKLEPVLGTKQKNSHDILKFFRFLFGCDEGALNQELVLAFGRQRGFFLHWLKHY